MSTSLVASLIDHCRRRRADSVLPWEMYLFWNSGTVKFLGCTVAVALGIASNVTALRKNKLKKRSFSFSRESELYMIAWRYCCWIIILHNLSLNCGALRWRGGVAVRRWTCDQ